MEAVFDDSEGDTEVKTVSCNVDACIGDTKFRFAQYLRFLPASYAHYVDAYEHNLLYHRWSGKPLSTLFVRRSKSNYWTRMRESATTSALCAQTLSSFVSPCWLGASVCIMIPRASLACTSTTA